MNIVSRIPADDRDALVLATVYEEPRKIPFGSKRFFLYGS